MKKETKKTWKKLIATCYDEDFRDNFTINKAISFFEKYYTLIEKPKK